MRHSVIGDRTGSPVFLKIPIPARIGDLCALRMLMSEWRHDHPDERLSVSFDATHHNHCYSRQVPLEWVFSGIADETWTREHIIEILPELAGEEAVSIYNKDANIIQWPDKDEENPAVQVYTFFNWEEGKNMVHMWAAWRRFMFARNTQPVIKATNQIIERARAYLERYKVPKDFVVIQPLYDAGYHRYRNGPQKWWEELVDRCAGLGIPVAVLGNMTFLRKTKFKCADPLAFPLFERVGNPFDSMGIISLSRGMAGGETGIPLWSAMMKVPVVATLRNWDRGNDGQRRLEYRPISFGSPVLYGPLSRDPDETAVLIHAMFNGTAVSKPVV